MLGTLVPYIDIHDLHYSIRDVFSNNGQHTQFLYTYLPPHIEDYMKNTHFNFNDNIADTFIWSNNKNGAYSTKSGTLGSYPSQILKPMTVFRLLGRRFGR